jgi:hypothetical protein
LYCPQCGAEITGVFSQDVRKEDDIIWLYPQPDTHDFRFSLSLLCLGKDREQRVTLPQLNLAKSSLSPQDWFEPTFEQIGPQPGGQAMLYRLRPKKDRVQELGELWYSALDPNGLRASLTAVGEFQPKTFQLRICNSPAFAFRFHGDDVLDLADSTETGWRVLTEDMLTLALDIEATTAPVYLEKGITLEMDGQPSTGLKPDWPPRRGELIPVDRDKGERPWSTTLTVNTTGWTEEEAHQLVFRLALGSFGPLRVDSVLRLQPAGRLLFSPERVTLETVYYKDLLQSGKPDSLLPIVSVKNVGKAAVFLRPPTVRATSGPVDRIGISAEWLHGESTDAPRLLQPEDHAEIALTIDLRNVPEGVLDGQELRAAVVLANEFREWLLDVFIFRVLRRPVAQRRLAVDFGSTNTYAGVWNSDARAAPDKQVVPVLVDPHPERFPSVMFFHDVSDPANPQYVVGPEAARLGASLPTAMVSGLKRLIGRREQDGSWRKIHICDRHGNHVPYDVPTLVKLAFRDLLRQCEDRLQEKIELLCFSFPANFDDERLYAYKEIVASLAHHLACENPPRRLEFAPPKIDEASAVTLGFVLDPKTQTDLIEKLLTPERPWIVVASFDVGGGTVDTALIRVQFSAFRGGIRWARFETDYLGFGGDRDFGGDNVTVAVFEELYDQLLQLLGGAPVGPAADSATEAAAGTVPDAVADAMADILGGAEATAQGACPLVPLARSGARASAVARTNFDALWSAAEQVKFHLCNPERTQAEDAALGAKLTMELNRLCGLFGDQGDERALFDDAAIRARLDAAIRDRSLLRTLTLQQVYDHCNQIDLGDVRGVLDEGVQKLRRGFRALDDGTKPTVRQRIEKCVDELAEFCRRRRDVTIDFIVLAGAGARLPLVEELLRERFPDTYIHKDMQRAKSKVACGLVRYFALEDKQPHRVALVRCSTHYTPYPIGLWEPASQTIQPIVPVCMPVDDDRTWYQFPVSLISLWNSPTDRVLELWQDVPDAPRRLGVFRLSTEGRESPRADHDAGGTSIAVERRLPAELSGEDVAAIRFVGGGQEIELKVEDQGRCFGYWRLQPDLLPYPIGLLDPQCRSFRGIIPVGAPIALTGRWYDFPIPLADAWSEPDTWCVELHLDVRGKPVLLGTFGLGTPGQSPAADDTDGVPCAAGRSLPPEWRPSVGTAAIRFVGGLDQLELKVRGAGQCWGYWRLQTQVVPAGERLAEED